MKITLAIPTNRGIRPKTAQCLLDLVAHGGYEFHTIVAERGFTIAENRNYVAIQAMNKNSDYLLFIDDDMTFEPDLLDRLLAHEKEIVGVAFHPRCDVPVNDSMDEVHFIKLRDATDEKYKSLFSCKAVGTGILLIKTEVLKKMPPPWFAFEYLPTGQVKVGEDWYFCNTAKAWGYEIWCDPTIKVGHIGEKIY